MQLCTLFLQPPFTAATASKPDPTVYMGAPTDSLQDLPSSAHTILVLVLEHVFRRRHAPGGRSTGVGLRAVQANAAESRAMAGSKTEVRRR